MLRSARALWQPQLRIYASNLELGGKSPCIVTENANIKLAAKRIVWGKFLNSGQTCIAPDYILVSEKIKDELITQLKRFIEKQYTSDPLTYADYPKIVNERHFNRLLRLIEGEKIISGGKSDRDKLKIEPTLLDEPAADSPVMSEEIFGPILPIISFDTIENAAKHIKTPEALALYVFSECKDEQKYLLRMFHSAAEQLMIHTTSAHLPQDSRSRGSGMGNTTARPA